MNPEYPVYIISKGRWKNPLTAKELDFLNIPYKIVVEPQEYDFYRANIDQEKILVLPFSNLGLGSIPARNWVWEHAMSIGAVRHWILDDNISHFYRLNRNRKNRVADGTIFRCAEIFVDRYKNIALSGFNYESLCVASEPHPAFYLNTRIYSCILINNNIPYRWRGKYNEDTDLSIRVLKDGYCTVLFNAFLANKTCTMRMRGGNTDELYAGDGRKLMAQSLAEQHPDIVRVTWKFNRWHHQVNYAPFKKNKLIKIDPNKSYPKINEYGMSLKQKDYL